MTTLLKSSRIVTLLASLVFAVSANADVWTFTLPSTAAQSPPYEAIATLTLVQDGANVKFTLDPNEANGGVSPPGPGQSEIKFIDFVYAGRALNGTTDLGNVVGAAIDYWDYETNQNNMDSGYKTRDQHLQITFVNGFNVTMTSEWTIFNVNLADFTGTAADSNSKPTPTMGVISIAPFAHPDQSPDPSNWVTGFAEVPEPATLGLLGLGLLGMGLARRRKTV